MRLLFASVAAAAILLSAWPNRGGAEPPPSASSLAASGSQVSEAQVQQLAALLAQAFPLGTMMDASAARDPKWPLEGKVNLVTPDQFACLRSEMSSAGWRQLKLSQAREYALAHPERIAGDLRILRDGVAPVLGHMLRANMLAKEKGTPFDRHAALASVSARQMHAFLLFARDPGYAQLRELVGIGDSLNLNASMEKNQNAGYAKGTSIVLDFMFHSMDDCKIPPATLM